MPLAGQADPLAALPSAAQVLDVLQLIASVPLCRKDPDTMHTTTASAWLSTPPPPKPMIGSKAPATTATEPVMGPGQFGGVIPCLRGKFFAIRGQAAFAARPTKILSRSA